MIMLAMYRYIEAALSVGGTEAALLPSSGRQGVGAQYKFGAHPVAYYALSQWSQ